MTGADIGLGDNPGRPSRTRRARRLKYSIMLVIAAGSGLALLGWTQTWYGLVLIDSAGHAGPLAVSGQVAAPAVSALALSGLALAGALSIAGPVLRAVFGVLEALLGASVILSVVLSELDPVTAGAPVVSQVTGVTGTDSVHALVSTASSTLWPIVTLIAGVAMLAAGIVVIVTLRRWPDSSQKYQSVRLEADPQVASDDAAAEATATGDEASGDTAAGFAAESDEFGFDPARDDEPDEAAGEDPTDPVSAWDDLTRGSDPTDRPDKPKRRG